MNYANSIRGGTAKTVTDDRVRPTDDRRSGSVADRSYPEVDADADDDTDVVIIEPKTRIVVRAGKLKVEFAS